MVVSNGTPKWLVQVYGVMLVQLAPKIALIDHRSAPLSQKVCLSIGAYSRLYCFYTTGHLKPQVDVGVGDVDGT